MVAVGAMRQRHGEIGRLLFLRDKLDSDSTIADVAAGPVEHRLTTDLKPLLRTVVIDAAENEIQKWLPGRDHCMEFYALRCVPAVGIVDIAIAHEGFDANAQHFEDRAGNVGEPSAFILLPMPIA